MCDNRNHYEIERDNFYTFSIEIIDICTDLKLGIGLINNILDFLRPYACTADPYYAEYQKIYELSRFMEAGTMDPNMVFYGINNKCIKQITEFLMPNVLFTEPIPCAITTFYFQKQKQKIIY
jgi:hypothetical protein